MVTSKNKVKKVCKVIGVEATSIREKDDGSDKGVFPASSINDCKSSTTITHKSYLPIHFTSTEKQDVKDLADANPSFYQNVLKNKINLTETIEEELRNIMYGKIPRNFIINIKNCVGSPTGVFKSSFGLQFFCLKLDPTFVVKDRVAFTANQLNDLIKKNADRKQIFVLDERVHDLKQSAEVRLANIAESCRERQICLVLVGVAEKFLNISHYHFERFGESSDEFLPDKTVYFLVKKITETKKIYRGYIKHNITPLNDKLWNHTWGEYMRLKSEHQEKVIQQQLTGFDFEHKAKELMEKHKEFISGNCITKSGNLDKSLIRNLIYKEMPDVTNDERKMVFIEITCNQDKYLIEQDNKEESDTQIVTS